MRKVILQEFLTLDGLAAGPDGSTDYIPASTQGDQSFGQHQFGLAETIDAILLGRVTYGMFASYWPTATSDPFAETLNAIPKIVFSRTLERAPWGKYPDAELVRTGAAEEVGRRKAQSGKDMIVWGSLSLARSLMKAKLIDQYQLVICPVVMGRGTPLFREDGPALDLKLQEATRFDRGAVLLRYSS